jgi:hypothetical protein
MTILVPATACPLADFARSDAMTQRIDNEIEVIAARARQMARDPGYLADYIFADMVSCQPDAAEIAREAAYHWLASNPPASIVDAIARRLESVAADEIAKAVRQ